MYLTVHGATALALARLSPNPLVGFVLGLVSHVVLDVIPHGDELPRYYTGPRKLRRIFGAGVLDGLVLSFFLVIYVWTTPNVNLSLALASVLGAVLPDALQALYFITEKPPGWLQALQRWHRSIHNPFRHNLDWTQGLLVQALTFAAVWLLLL